MWVTAVSGLIESMIKEIQNTMIRDLSATQCTPVHMHPSAYWLLSGSEPDNSQQMDAYELTYDGYADKCLCQLFEARWNCEGLMDDSLFWNFFNHITHLFNEP